MTTTLPFRRASRRRAAALAGLLAAALAGCAATPPATFDLGAATGRVPAREARRAQIAIGEPSALPLLDSNRIVARSAGERIAYLPGAQWSDRLPALLQARLIASFQNASLIRAAAAPGQVADYELRSQLRRFEFDAARSSAAVEIAVQIVGPAGRIMAGKVFAAEVATAADNNETIIAALNAASADVMRQIVRWTAPQI